MKRIIRYVKIYFNFIKSGLYNDDIKYLTNCDVIFICHDVDRSVKRDKLAYCPLLDSIREEFEGLGLKCISVAHFGSKITGNKGFGYPLGLNRKYFYYLIISKLYTFLGLGRIFERPDFYNYLFEKTTPKMVIAIGATANLCQIARTKNILVVELLHGTGYRFIPWGWDKREAQYLPEVILSLDYVSSSSFSPLLKCGIKIFTIPNPFLKRFISARKSSLPNEWKYCFGSGFKKTILISLSWGYSGDHGVHLEFSGILKDSFFYEELLDVIRDNKDIFWCFRLHPVQMANEKYRDLKEFLDGFVKRNSNCEWIQSSSLPFPIIAANCAGNISMASMSCYDAAAMGLPSLMLCPTIQPGGIHEDWFEDLVKEGYVTKANISIEYLNKWVNVIDKLPLRITNLYDEKAWMHACEWMFEKTGIYK